MNSKRGVMILVNKKLQECEVKMILPDLHTDYLNISMICIRDKKKQLQSRFIIIGFYNPPETKKASIRYLKDMILCVKRKYKNHNTIIAGDFNNKAEEVKVLQQET